MNIVKTLFLSAAVLSSTVSFSQKAVKTTKVVASKAVSLNVDAKASSFGWLAKKVGGEHSGSISIQSGTLTLAAGKLVSGDFVINTKSITNSDITNEEYKGKLIGHLNSPDFFDTEKHPTATLKTTKVVSKGNGNYVITGNLTIKGITNPITFPATVKIDSNGAVATAKFNIDRTKYDIKYNAAIIGTAADKIIEDTFACDVKIVATK